MVIEISIAVDLRKAKIYLVGFMAFIRERWGMYQVCWISFSVW